MFVFVFVITSVLICFENIGARAEDCVGSDRIVRGGYWYLCEDGNEVRKGCVQRGVQYNVNNTYISGRSEIKCRGGGSIGIRRVKVGCTTDDSGTEVIKVGDIHEVDNLRYMCTTISFRPIGCVVEGRSIRPRKKSVSKTTTLPGNEGLVGKVMDECEVTLGNIRLYRKSHCKLYKNEDEIVEIQWGCSTAVQVDGQEKIFHCGTAATGTDDVALNERQEGETVGCVVFD